MSYAVYNVSYFLKLANLTNYYACHLENSYFLPFIQCSCSDHSQNPECLLELCARVGIHISVLNGLRYISDRYFEENAKYSFYTLLSASTSLDKMNLDDGLRLLLHPEQTEVASLFGPEINSSIWPQSSEAALPLDRYESLSFEFLMQRFRSGCGGWMDGLFERETEQIQRRIHHSFVRASYPSSQLSPAGFHGFLRTLNFEISEIPHYFRCFSSTTPTAYGQGYLTFQQFLVGLACMDSGTLHGGQSGELRSRLIFRFYDRDHDGLLCPNDLRKMIQDIYRKRQNQDISEQSLEKHLHAAIEEFGVKEPGSVGFTEDKFLLVVGNLRFRGTSVLLRLSEAASFSRPLQQQQRRRAGGIFKVHKGSFESYDGEEVCQDVPDISESSTDYALAVHSVTVHRRDCSITVRPIWDDIKCPHQLGELGDKLNNTYDRLQSFNNFNQSSFPNEILQALNYFRYPDTKKDKKQLSWGDVKMDVLGQYINVLCDDVLTIITKEPRMLEISSPVHVLGDLHGNYVDLIEFEESFWRLGLGLAAGNFLFLGDYVDRGQCGVEVCTYLLAQKLLNPGQVHLLRGNHEIRSVQQNYSFHDECLSKFGPGLGKVVWESINNVFDALSVAAVIDNRLFCVHGGIPRPSLLLPLSPVSSTTQAISQLRHSINTRVPCPLSDPESDSPLAWELMWSDPIRPSAPAHNNELNFTGQDDNNYDEIESTMEIDPGFSHNSQRQTACFFDEVALTRFLDRYGFSHVIRAHEVQQIGFNVQHGARLITVFSSSHYCNKTNEAACLFVNNGKLRLLRLASDD